jgi:FKBP-type peptidyl-prolyl cis-trans isomerase FklB
MVKRSTIIAATLPLLLASAAATAQESYTSEKQKFGYAVGWQLGKSIKADEGDMDTAATVQAIKDSMAGAEPKVPLDEMRGVMDARRKQRVEEVRALVEKKKQESDAFLAGNKKKPGVKEAASGLQYKELTAGKGKSPKATDTVVVHYRGALLDGREFDSSLKRDKPATLPVGSLIKGFQEALTMMKAGAKWQVWIPPKLAYGAQGAPGRFGPNETLVFDIELLEIK